jgi:hypothetical protein
LRRAIYIHDSTTSSASMPGFALSFTVSLLFAAAMMLLTSWVAAGRTTADLE